MGAEPAAGGIGPPVAHPDPASTLGKTSNPYNLVGPGSTPYTSAAFDPNVDVNYLNR